MRRLLPILLAAALSSCATDEPASKVQVSQGAADLARRRSMVHTTTAGPLRVESVIYKPKYLPLGRFLKRLAAGDFDDARRMAPLKFRRANVDDAALKALIKHGLIPVYAEVTNLGPQTVDAGRLTLFVTDSSESYIEPISNESLPAVLNTVIGYRKTNSESSSGDDSGGLIAGLLSSAVVLTVAAGTDAVRNAAQHKKSDANFDGAVKMLSENNWLIDSGRKEQSSRESSEPVIKTTEIDYHGLLFHAAPIAPGESIKGLLFYNAEKMDWSALDLHASLAP